MRKLTFIAAAAFLAMTACNSKSATTPEAAADSVPAAVKEFKDTVATVVDAHVRSVVTVRPGEDPAPTADKPAVIDFSATWCGPCQQFKPIYDKVAGEYADKATFYSADLDELAELGKKYGVTSIPCIVILKKDAEPIAQVGYMDENEFKSLLDKNL